MYLKNKLVRFLKIKNIIFLIVGLFWVAASIADLLSLIVYYFGDWETVWTARSTPEAIVMLIIGAVLLIASAISRSLLNDAGFYSNYFEGDLDGFVTFEELSDVMGKSVFRIKTRLRLIRPLYMKQFWFKTVDNRQVIELYSKVALCECRNCGAPIEKRVYFTGVCPYCQGSNLFAKVISGDQFYSISNSAGEGVSQPAFYRGRGLTAKKLGYVLWLCFTLFIVIILGLFIIDTIGKYNSQDYLTEELLSGRSYSSFDLIKAGLLNSIVWSAIFFAAFAPLVPALIIRVRTIALAQTCANLFSRYPDPFVPAENLRVLGQGQNPRRLLAGVRRAVRARYLVNATLEKHGGVLRIALAKRVTRDLCPYCAGPIIGAANESYQCQYCRRYIMGVVQKK